ncbi:hypothetical protein SAMN02910369_02812 [Lachnospiraceae bacterium NE2001]|nr:hypothetical protein SAMN02910369_02812 [Lachnospiraceae bacterium NE2001]
MGDITTKKELLQAILDDYKEKKSIDQDYKVKLKEKTKKNKYYVDDEDSDLLGYYTKSFIWSYLEEKYDSEAQIIKNLIRNSDSYLSIYDVEKYMKSKESSKRPVFNKYSRLLALTDILSEEFKLFNKKSSKSIKDMTIKQLIDKDIFNDDLVRRIEEYENISGKYLKKETISNVSSILNDILEKKSTKMLKTAVRDYFNGYGIRMNDTVVDVPYSLRDDIYLLRRFEKYIDDNNAYKTLDSNIVSSKTDYDEDYILEVEKLYKYLNEKKMSDTILPIALSPTNLEGIFILGDSFLGAKGEYCRIFRIHLDDTPLSVKDGVVVLEEESFLFKEYETIKDAFTDFDDDMIVVTLYHEWNDQLSQDELEQVPDSLKKYFIYESFSENLEEGIDKINRERENKAKRKSTQQKFSKNSRPNI